MKNIDSEAGADAVGEEIEPVAHTPRHEGFLDDFGESAIGNADDDGENQGSFAVGFVVGNELLAVAPNAEEGKSGIHECMHDLVKTYNGLDIGQIRTRKPCQNQDDDSAQDSRVTISGQSFQGINRSWLHRRRHPRGRRPRRRRSP